MICNKFSTVVREVYGIPMDVSPLLFLRVWYVSHIAQKGAQYAKYQVEPQSLEKQRVTL